MPGRTYIHTHIQNACTRMNIYIYYIYIYIYNIYIYIYIYDWKYLSLNAYNDMYYAFYVSIVQDFNFNIGIRMHINFSKTIYT